MPDRGRALERMQLEEKLYKLPQTNIYGAAIHGLLAIRKPMESICEFIMDQYRDDEKGVSKSIGLDTLIAVKKFYCTH